MNKNHLKEAFNIRANFRDIFHSEDKRMLFMDGLRCLGMFHIMLTHCLWAFLMGYKTEFNDFIQGFPWYMRWMFAGDKAVDLFFVISGFLIGQMLFREYNKTGGIDIKRFFLRRFWRLAPAYYLVILIFALTAGPHVQKIYLWAFVFYVNNYIPIEHNYINFAWSLAIEEQFYAIFSVFVAFVFFRIKRQLSFLWFLYVLSFLIIFYLLYINPDILLSVDVLVSHKTNVESARQFWQIIYDNLHTRYGAIVLGIILAHLYVYHWARVQAFMTQSRSVLLLLIALGLFVLTMALPVFSGEATPRPLLYFYHVTHRNLFALGVMFVMLLCLLNTGLGAKVNTFLSSRVFYPMSQLTYSMYLLQLPVIYVCYHGLKMLGVVDALNYTNLLLVYFLAIPLTVLVSSLMFVFVERPFMKLRS